MKKKYNKALIDKYPFLMPRNVWTDKIPKGYNYDYTLYDSIDPGWRKAFGTLLLDELKESLEKYGYVDKFRFTQIKEKYGQLCLYNFGCPKETHDIIHKYEWLSQYFCNMCGRPAPMLDYYGWTLPMCRGCFNHRTDILYKQRGFKKYTYEEALLEGEKPDFGPDDVPREYYMTRSYFVEETDENGERIRKEEKITYDISDTVEKILRRYKR